MGLFDLVKGPALRIMKAPREPPDAPAGSHDEIRVFRASPRFLAYRLLGFAFLCLLIAPLPPLLMLVGLGTSDALPFWIGVLLAPLAAFFLFCCYFSVRIDYEMRYYIVTDRSLRVREGAFIVREKTLSFANVQNLRIVQGPLMRLFGFWHLEVDSAGGGAKEGEEHSSAHRIRVAGIEDAHRLRDGIRAHLRKRGQSSGLGDPDERDDERDSAFLEALREVAEATAALRTSVTRDRTR